ncbi:MULTISPECIES: purine-cytosine permease family protein [unclassified Mycolicibacterium]|uniref:purine-cytosine permease family protein n=1 Tax=unclassified Mycolicibacterium TaxID=2636767 RepID=UPI002ED8A154
MAEFTVDPVVETEANVDRAGVIERVGVEHLPEQQRQSSPRNLFAIFFGGNLAFSVILFGWLPVTFGLTFFEALGASVTGLIVGLLLIYPMALLGPRTGTNNPVSSGATFGVRGRLIGSTITLIFALAYAAIAVWTSGEALVAGTHRLINTPQTQTAFLIGYAIVALEIVLLALYGHGTIVLLQKLIVPAAAAIMLLGIFALAPHFDPNYRAGGYLLGDFWPTWLFAATISVGGPLSYAPSIGDYTRRISPKRFTDRQIGLAACAGIFVGLMITSAFGAFTATTFTKPSASYVADLVTSSPTWYVVPILALALLGGCGQGVMSIYSSGLDLESIIPRLTRTQTTLITSGIALGLMYLGVVTVSAIESITAMTVVLNAIAGPWVAINIVGFYQARKRAFDVIALQRFGVGVTGGRYWFTHGWNLRAVISFAIGSIIGLLTVDNNLYRAPWADIAGGIDVSLFLSAGLGALLYSVALRIWPEHGINDDI